MTLTVFGSKGDNGRSIIFVSKRIPTQSPGLIYGIAKRQRDAESYVGKWFHLYSPSAVQVIISKEIVVDAHEKASVN